MRTQWYVDCRLGKTSQRTLRYIGAMIGKRNADREKIVNAAEGSRAGDGHSSSLNAAGDLRVAVSERGQAPNSVHVFFLLRYGLWLTLEIDGVLFDQHCDGTGGVGDVFSHSRMLTSLKCFPAGQKPRRRMCK